MSVIANNPNAGKGLMVFLLRKGGLAFLLRLITMIGQYLLVFTLARLHGPSGIGSFTIALTILQLAAILAQAGLDNRLIRVLAASGESRERPEFRSIYTQSLKITAGLSIIFSILLFFSAEWLANTVFHKTQLISPLRWMAIALTPFVLIGFNGAAFRAMKNMTGFLLFRASIPYLTAILILAGVEADLLNPAASYTIATVILCGASFVTWYRYARMSSETIQPALSSKIVLQDALPMMLTGSIFFLMNWTDNILLGIYKTDSHVGLYDIAFKIASASAIVLIGLNAIQAPLFAEYFSKGKHAELHQQVRLSSKIIVLITFPFTILLFIFSEEILLFFGEDFRHAETALLILAFGNLISCMSGSVGILLQMTGHQVVYNRIISIVAAMSILLNLWLIPRYGITGAAISSSIAKICQNLISVTYTYRKLGLLTIYLPGIHRIFPIKNPATT